LKEHGVREEDVGKAKVPLRIIVSGAGIGGLATSIALARRGHHVTAFEQVEQLAEVRKFENAKGRI
jgi:salicylate hydroxylase